MRPLQGIFTALITPFKNGKVDEKAFQDFIEWQVSQGVHGIVPCGTTGESPTLSFEEHTRIVRLAVEAAAGRVTVLAGTGANNTEEAIHFTKEAKQAGADAAMLVAPYYNKPTQEGLYQHYKTVQDAVEIPIVIYNIPGRSVVNITDDTLTRLAKLPNIAGVKDATGDLARVSTLRFTLQEAGVTKPFHVFSGEDMTAVAFNAAGGTGCISVTSNVMPRRLAETQAACLEGDYKKALALHEPLVPLHLAMFVETSPAPVKYALSLMGKCDGSVRLPMVPLSAQHRPTVEAALTRLKLI